MNIVITVFALLFAVVSATEASGKVECTRLYTGTLALVQNQPMRSQGVGISKDPIEKFGRQMLLYNENQTSSHDVTFSECKVPGQPDPSGEHLPNDQYGRLELSEKPGTCLAHFTADEEHQVVLGLEPCRDTADEQQKHQWFLANWNGESDSAELDAINADVTEYYSQWSSQFEQNKHVLTVRSAHFPDGHYQWFQLKNPKKAEGKD